MYGPNEWYTLRYVYIVLNGIGCGPKVIVSLAHTHTHTLTKWVVSFHRLSLCDNGMCVCVRCALLFLLLLLLMLWLVLSVSKRARACVILTFLIMWITRTHTYTYHMRNINDSKWDCIAHFLLLLCRRRRYFTGIDTSDFCSIATIFSVFIRQNDHMHR